MRNPRSIATALAVVLGLGAASAVQAALDEAAQKSFDRADVDGDGTVSWRNTATACCTSFTTWITTEMGG
jgi:N-acetylglutamate synthase/N-acetylornithine aminotransferase